jgi:nucleotide-binding universal stress UspA family protein
MFKKILCAVDSTHKRYDVVNVGYKLGKLTGGKIILLHVIEMPTQVVDLNPDVEEAGYKKASALIDELKKEIKDPDIIDEIAIQEGENPSIEIYNTAKKFNVDLIVLGRKTGFEASIMHHSVARFLIEKSKVPLLIV